MKIKEDVLQVLNESKLDNNILYLPPKQLERKLYTDVNKVLELLGGKWNRSLKGHKFEIDVEEMLNDAINFGEVIELGNGAFKDSGTMVKTRIIKVTKGE